MLPDIPALSETLPGYEASTWFGIGVPKSTPTEVIDKLNREINAALADPNMKKRLTDLGAAVFAGAPEDFTKFIADESDKWAKVIKFAGIKAQ
jgi:tripartite-type tricarboxylate transporter receptor subunit TctC